MSQSQVPAEKKLNRYRPLAPLAGLHVSPIVLGAMSIGHTPAAKNGMAIDKESSFKLLDAYFDAGGNFIDTANYYQEGTSESVLGEWMESRGVRDQVVVATKVSLCITCLGNQGNSADRF